MNELKQKTETRIFPTVEHLTGGKVEKACRVFVWISALISGLWAGLFPNFIDDAFISLRYSQNLAMGEGLVWNSGQYLEGFTNFLWTLILYLPFTLHIDPLIFIRILGGILQVGLVFMSARLARKLIGDHLAVCLVALLVAVHPSLLGFATSGMETTLQSLLITLLAVFVCDSRTRPSAGKLVFVSILGALAVLTRLDSVAAVFPLCAVLLLGDRRSKTFEAKAPSLLWLLLPGGLILLTFFVWKMVYYGDIIPNTYYAKMGVGSRWRQGLEFLWVYSNSYLVWPLWALLAVGFVRAVLKRATQTLPLFAALILWLAYIVHVGGDFMEFRFLVPVIPLIITLLFWSASLPSYRKTVWIALAILIACGFLHHQQSFKFTRGIESIESMSSHVSDPEVGWEIAGKDLKQIFGKESDFLIAVMPAGAIPYYSGLPSVDMLGLNDIWIPMHGIRVDRQRGHCFQAPAAYLVQRKVNLIIGHPLIIRQGVKLPEKLDSFGRYVLDPQNLPESARAVAIPLEGGQGLIAIYLTGHPAMDKAIEEGGWEVFDIKR